MTPTDSPTATTRPIDREALRRKYREERDKRLRPDGNAQYVQASGVFARYLDDPYKPIEPRAAKTDHVSFAFVGGGFAGLVTAARLVEAGVTDVRIVHRLGRMEVGETSVAIVVTAPHRGPAFEACRYAIDTLKKTVPIWKKEFYADGAVWREGPGEAPVEVTAT